MATHTAHSTSHYTTQCSHSTSHYIMHMHTQHHTTEHIITLHITVYNILYSVLPTTYKKHTALSPPANDPDKAEYNSLVLVIPRCAIAFHPPTKYILFGEREMCALNKSESSSSDYMQSIACFLSAVFWFLKLFLRWCTPPQ